MRFERDLDVKEALKIGRLANATKIDGYQIMGIISFKGNFRDTSYSYNTKDIESTQMILKSLEKDGFTKSPLIEKLFKEAFRRSQPKSEIFSNPVVPISKVFIKSIRIGIQTDYAYAITYVYTHELSGEDLLFEDVLYVMPKIYR